MTIINKSLEELKAELEDSAQKVADVLNNPESDDATEKNARNAMKAALAAYNKKAAENAYEGWRDDFHEHAVREAIRSKFVPKAVKVSVRKGKTGRYAWQINDAEIMINLKDMMDTIGAEGFFPDRQWFGAIQRLIYIMAGNINKELGLQDRDFKECLKAAGATFEFAPDANFTSNRSCKKALQKTIDMIIFEQKDPEKEDSENIYKIDSYWLAYINYLMCGHDKHGNVELDTLHFMDLMVHMLGFMVKGTRPDFTVQ